MIREANKEDFEQVVAMAERFWNSGTMFDDAFDYDHVYNMVSICHDNALLFVAEINGKLVGFVAGIVGGLLGSGAVKVGTELAWWLEPEHRGGSLGVKMLKAAEKRAKELGVKYWNMAFMCSSMPDVVESMYKKMGYVKSEVVYTRRLL